MVMAVHSLFVARPNKLAPAPNGTPSIPPNGSNVLEVRMFNVGKGEAVLITFPPRRAWLIDGGATNGDPKNRILGEKLLAYLKSNDLKLEGLVASHPHKDHVGAVFYLLQKKPKLASKLLYFYTWDYPPSKPKREWLTNLESQLIQLGKKVEMVDMRDKHREVLISNRAQIHLFAGSGEGAYTSIFMHVHFKDAAFFFSGDAECGYEKDLLDSHV